MAEQFIQLPPNSTGLKVRTFEQTVGANVVEHQAFVLCDSNGNIISSLNAVPAGTEYGLVVRPIGPISVQGLQSTPVTGSITTATSTVAAAVTNYTNVSVSISGTYAGVNITFEASDDSGVTYYPIQVQREVDSVPLSTSGLLTNANVLYSMSAPGITHIRVRATAWTSGSATIRISPGTMPLEPVVSVGNSPTIANVPVAAALADGTANPTTSTIAAVNELYNGTTVDRQRGNLEVVMQASTARTATITVAGPTNYNARGVIVLIAVTATSGVSPTMTGTFQVNIAGTNVALGGASTALAAVGNFLLVCYPGATTTGPALVVSQPLPRNWGITFTIGGTTPSITFTATASFIV